MDEKRKDAIAREIEGGIIMVDVCPYCGDWHTHGGTKERDNKGARLADCGKGEYWLMFEKTDDPEKMEKIKAGWGDETPDYMWFDLGKKNRLDEEETKKVKSLFFGFTTPPSFGDIELHSSSVLPAGHTCLRIRNAKNIHLSFTLPQKRFLRKPKDVEHMMYQVGHSDDQSTSKFIRFI